jgi:hypothetical protein
MPSSAALPDQSPRQENHTGADPVGPIRLADGLGVASVALGAPMLINPRRFLAAIGVRSEPRPIAATLAVGVREFVAAGTILGMRHRRIGAWSRVGGDVLDLGLLAMASRTRRRDPARLALATGAVATILATDLLTAVLLSRAEGTHIEEGSTSHGTGAGPDGGGGPARVLTAVTIRRAAEEVRREFRQFDWTAFDPAALETAGEVRFTAAPRDRGTEVHIDHDPAVPGGSVGATALKLAGRSPDQQIHDELRRFKARLETGVEPRSEKTPQGHSALGQILQRPAQPMGRGS